MAYSVKWCGSSMLSGHAKEPVLGTAYMDPCHSLCQGWHAGCLKGIWIIISQNKQSLNIPCLSFPERWQEALDEPTHFVPFARKKRWHDSHDKEKKVEFRKLVEAEKRSTRMTDEARMHSVDQKDIEQQEESTFIFNPHPSPPHTQRGTYSIF